MKFFNTLVFSLLALPLAVAANDLRFGMDVGAAVTSNVDGIYYNNNNASPAGRVFVEYNEDLLGIGASYNMFTNLDYDSMYADETDSMDIHGPEVYGKVKYRFGDFEPYGKVGLMYAMTNSNTMWLQNENKFSPTVGAGINWYAIDGFVIRAGYDKYWNIYDSAASGVKNDLDFWYAGMALTF